MKTSDFDYNLPSELIAQIPIESRDQSRLLVLNRGNGSITHRRFFEITDCLQVGDILLFNDSRVIPARLKGRKVDSGGKVEILLLRRLENNLWEALMHPGKRTKTGTVVEITDSFGEYKALAEVMEQKQDGIKVIKLSDDSLVSEMGQIPLPPYIHTPLKVPERYQTIYSRESGSVAAPTAGLHFTPELLNKIKEKGVHCIFTTLHIGLDTFRPVKEEDPREHTIHEEYGMISPEAAAVLSEARAAKRRIICVGTTAVRLVEQAAIISGNNKIKPFSGWVNLFILPGHCFRMVDALITNFHLPQSTLLMLVSAFAGKENIDRAYETAIAQKYRFYSFGDAMMIN
ncbi:tRNA preQ1(34) S-adenosylmethionine ribosyltransferase-isomerase QueA [Chloroflexota bacterium]